MELKGGGQFSENKDEVVVSLQEKIEKDLGKWGQPIRLPYDKYKYVTYVDKTRPVDGNKWPGLLEEVDKYIEEWKREHPRLSGLTVGGMERKVYELMQEFTAGLVEKRGEIDDKVREMIANQQNYVNQLAEDMQLSKRLNNDNLLKYKMGADKLWKKSIKGDDYLYLDVMDRLAESYDQFKLDCRVSKIDYFQAGYDEMKKVLKDHNEEIVWRNTNKIENSLKDMECRDIRGEKIPEEERRVSNLLKINEEIRQHLEMIRGQFVYNIETMVLVLRNRLSDGSMVESSQTDQKLFQDTMQVLKWVTISPRRFREDLGNKCLEKATWWGKRCDSVLEPLHKLMNGKKY